MVFKVVEKGEEGMGQHFMIHGGEGQRQRPSETTQPVGYEKTG